MLDIVEATGKTSGNFWVETTEALRRQAYAVADEGQMADLQRELRPFQRVFYPQTQHGDVLSAPMPFAGGQFVVEVVIRRRFSNGIDTERIVVVDRIEKVKAFVVVDGLNVRLINGGDSVSFPLEGTVEVIMPFSWPGLFSLGHEKKHLDDELLEIVDHLYARVKIAAYTWLKRQELQALAQITNQLPRVTPRTQLLFDHLSHSFGPFGLSEKEIVKILSQPYTLIEHDALIRAERDASAGGTNLLIGILDTLGDTVPVDVRESIIQDGRKYSSGALATYDFFRKFLGRTVDVWTF